MSLKIYTKQGDFGTTSLIGGRRVSKSDQQVNAYGNLDELNSHIGLLIAYLPKNGKTEKLHSTLSQIQKNIFTVGSFYSFDFASNNDFFLPILKNSEIEALENLIDFMQELLPPIDNFIMPGGSIVAAQAHIARCVCRRTERLIVALDFQSNLHTLNLAYLNRLSDFLFVTARYLNLIEEKN